MQIHTTWLIRGIPLVRLSFHHTNPPATMLKSLDRAIGNRQPRRSYITIDTPLCAWLLRDALVFWRPVFLYWTRCQTSSLCASGMSFLHVVLCTISYAWTANLMSCFIVGRMLMWAEVLPETVVMDLQVHLLVQPLEDMLEICLTRRSVLWIDLEMTLSTACGLIMSVIAIESGNMWWVFVYCGVFCWIVGLLVPLLHLAV